MTVLGLNCPVPSWSWTAGRAALSARLFHLTMRIMRQSSKTRAARRNRLLRNLQHSPRYLPARDRLEDEAHVCLVSWLLLFALLAISELDADDRPQPGAVEQRGGPVSQDVKLLPPLELTNAERELVRKELLLKHNGG